jgi:hypothetical protein
MWSLLKLQLLGDFISCEKTKWSDNSNHRFLKSHASKFIICHCLCRLFVMTKCHLRIQDYAAGWICALPIELTVETEMLDEEHQNLPQDGNDTNSYTAPCSMG